MSGRDIDQALQRMSTGLAAQFAGTIDADLVARYVNDSYVALHRTAHAHQQLPELAQRFAADRLTALAQATAVVGKPVPEVLFLCIHNAGRSQMGAALMAHHARGRINARSAGSQPGAAVSHSAATVLGELTS
jgi:arsenate reductase